MRLRETQESKGGGGGLPSSYTQGKELGALGTAWRGGGRGSLYLVCVPEADGAAKGKLPHKQVVHPTEGKL